MTLDPQWRDAFYLAMEQVGESWSIRPAATTDQESEMMILAYPASNHDAIAKDTTTLACISRPPTLTHGGTLVLVACGRSSPEVSAADTILLSSAHAIAEYAVGENIRPMRLLNPNSETISEMMVKHMGQLKLSGLNLSKAFTDGFETDIDSDALSDVETADL